MRVQTIVAAEGLEFDSATTPDAEVSHYIKKSVEICTSDEHVEEFMILDHILPFYCNLSNPATLSPNGFLV